MVVSAVCSCSTWPTRKQTNGTLEVYTSHSVWGKYTQSVNTGSPVGMAVKKGKVKKGI